MQSLVMVSFGWLHPQVRGEWCGGGFLFFRRRALHGAIVMWMACDRHLVRFVCCRVCSRANSVPRAALLCRRYSTMHTTCKGFQIRRDPRTQLRYYYCCLSPRTTYDTIVRNQRVRREGAPVKRTQAVHCWRGLLKLFPVSHVNFKQQREEPLLSWANWRAPTPPRLLVLGEKRLLPPLLLSDLHHQEHRAATIRGRKLLCRHSGNLAKILKSAVALAMPLPMPGLLPGLKHRRGIPLATTTMVSSQLRCPGHLPPSLGGCLSSQRGAVLAGVVEQAQSQLPRLLRMPWVRRDLTCLHGETLATTKSYPRRRNRLSFLRPLPSSSLTHLHGAKMQARIATPQIERPRLFLRRLLPSQPAGLRRETAMAKAGYVAHISHLLLLRWLRRNLQFRRGATMTPIAPMGQGLRLPAHLVPRPERPHLSLRWVFPGQPACPRGEMTMATTKIFPRGEATMLTPATGLGLRRAIHLAHQRERCRLSLRRLRLGHPACLHGEVMITKMGCVPHLLYQFLLRLFLRDLLFLPGATTMPMATTGSGLRLHVHLAPRTERPRLAPQLLLPSYPACLRGELTMTRMRYVPQLLHLSFPRRLLRRDLHSLPGATMMPIATTGLGLRLPFHLTPWTE